MTTNNPDKRQRFDKLTSSLIVAFVVGTVIVIPGLLAIAKQVGWQLPEPLQKLATLLGLG